MSSVSRLEVISTGARRRWPLAEKQRIVAESYRAPVSATARRNGLSASQLFTWRRLAREGRLGESHEPAQFAPAVVSDASLLSSLVSASEQVKAEEAPPSEAAGRIQIILNCGHRVIVETGADATALACVLPVLGRS